MRSDEATHHAEIQLFGGYWCLYGCSPMFCRDDLKSFAAFDCHFNYMLNIQAVNHIFYL